MQRCCSRGQLVLFAALALGAVRHSAAELEEVVVTAQKRPQVVQDVPLTVNVVMGSRLDAFSIRNTNDLAESVPGLSIQATPQNLAQIAIRGLGTGAAAESLDQSVGLFIDGIWAGRIREFQASLFDLERVEVIKGTQTTLLGKNTSLGAISLVSRRPGAEFSAYVQGDYEFEYDSTYLSAAMDLPTGFGNYRLALNDVAENGFVANAATGNEVPERDQTSYRLSAEYSPAADGLLLLSYQYDELEILGDSYQPDNDTSGFLAGMDPAADIGVDRRKLAHTARSASGDAEDEQRSQRLLVRYEHDIGGYRFTSLSGWSRYDNTRLLDADFLSVDYLTTDYQSDYRQFSQELQLASPLSARFDYLAGLYYLDSEMDYATTTDTRFPPPYTVGPLPIDSTSLRDYRQDTRVWSLFGQGSLYLSPQWRATLGLRYTDERKKALWARSRLRSGGPLADVLADLLAPVVPATPLARSEDNLDGSINIQRDINDELMVYLSWARGSKSGGFTTEVAVPGEAEFETEQADTSELGMKMGFAESALLLNAALFHTEIDNFQVIAFVGTGFVTETLPAESRGVELEARWAVSDLLSLAASATYSDAEDSASGLRLPYAPLWSGNLALGYQIPWRERGLRWQLGGQLNYRGEQYMQTEERIRADALTLLDVRLALGDSAGSWELALIGRNLLDDASGFGFDFPFFGGSGELPSGAATIGGLNRPRTLALQARYQF